MVYGYTHPTVLQFDYPNEMYILKQLYSTNSLSTACLGQVIIKIMQLNFLLQVQWTRLVVTVLRSINVCCVRWSYTNTQLNLQHNGMVSVKQMQCYSYHLHS